MIVRESAHSYLLSNSVYIGGFGTQGNLSLQFCHLRRQRVDEFATAGDVLKFGVHVCGVSHREGGVIPVIKVCVCVWGVDTGTE